MKGFHRSRNFTNLTLIMLIAVGLMICIQSNPLNAHAETLGGNTPIKIILQQEYLDGELSEEVTHEYDLPLNAITEKYKNWHLVTQNAKEIVFHRAVDDISPLLKTNGYFGITGDGTLSTFNGKPETNEVIQSFFQIDIKKLESHRQDELRKGIRIQSRDQYFEVIKSFESYSKTEKK